MEFCFQCVKFSQKDLVSSFSSNLFSRLFSFFFPSSSPSLLYFLFSSFFLSPLFLFFIFDLSSNFVVLLLSTSFFFPFTFLFFFPLHSVYLLPSFSISCKCLILNKGFRTRRTDFRIISLYKCSKFPFIIFSPFLHSLSVTLSRMRRKCKLL